MSGRQVEVICVSLLTPNLKNINETLRIVAIKL